MTPGRPSDGRARYAAFQRAYRGKGLTATQKRRLYKRWDAETGAGEADDARPMAKRPSPLRDGLSVEELCSVLCAAVPLRDMGYELQGVIGSGSYGIVLRVRLAKTGEHHVMKISRISGDRLQPVKLPVINNQHTSWHSIAPEDFRRSVTSHRKMKSVFPDLRIPALLRAGRVNFSDTERLGVIVMERVPGITLRKVLASDREEEDTKRMLIAKAARILLKIHSKGVVHADYHSWNLLTDASGHIHIIDFDRTSRTSAPSHRLHDLAMLCDTMDERFWQVFFDTYFRQKGARNPFVLHATEAAARKKEMHERSRELFANYLVYLRGRRQNQ